ncbi:MFS general substrate transporter [Wallemia mellicola]|nr:MFS general substrate transporter [Wallemia mellicola]
MENTQHNLENRVSTVDPIPVTFNLDSRRSSFESSSQTHLETFEASLKEKYNSSERINLKEKDPELEQRPKDLYFFHDKAYRVKKKWILFAVTCLSFATIGLNDSSIGALMPQMEVYYNKSESIMSLSFLANSGGYLLMISTFIYAAGSLIGTFKPPFAALMVSLVMTGVGGGSMSSPFLVGGLRESERPWELYFWFPFALTCFLFVLQWFVYRSYKAPIEAAGIQISASRRLRIICTNPMCILAIILSFLTIGIQGSWSQWASKYLQDTKKLESGVPQLAQGTFWAGVTVSRIVLSYVIPVVGYNLSPLLLLAGYAATSAGMWKLPTENIAGAMCLNVLLGFATGPLMPLIISGLCSGLLGSSILPLVIGQGVDTFNTDIIPGVLIVVLLLIFCINVILHLFKYRDLANQNGNERSLYQFMRITYTFPQRSKDTAKL